MSLTSSIINYRHIILQTFVPIILTILLLLISLILWVVPFKIAIPGNVLGLSSNTIELTLYKTNLKEGLFDKTIYLKANDLNHVFETEMVSFDKGKNQNKIVLKFKQRCTGTFNRSEKVNITTDSRLWKLLFL